MTPEETIQTLQLNLPSPPKAVGSYVPVRVAGNLATVSGQVPIRDGGILYPGKVGAEVTFEQAVEAAKQCALQALSALKAELGELSRIEKVFRVEGFVASVPEFTDQPKVLNAVSDLLVEVFGEAGKHARIALGTNVLPLNAPVEVAITVEIR